MVFQSKINLLFIVLVVLNILLLSSCRPNGKLINEKKSHSYFISNSGKLSYCQNGNLFEIGETVFTADKESLEILSETIAKDKFYVYFEGKKQPNIDTKSFYLENDIPKDKNFAYSYHNHLKPLKNVDAKSYEVLENKYESIWSRDKNNYYRDEEKVDVDRKSFIILNRRFCKDKNNTYVDLSDKYISVIHNSRNINTLTSEYILKDNTLYYVSNEGIIHIEKNRFTDIKKIRILNKDIVCIDNKVLIEGQIFKYSKVDANSFKILGKYQERYSKDKNHVYHDQKIIRIADPKTFKVIDFDYGKDKKNVYYKTRILKDADVNSFRPENEYSSVYIDDTGNKFEDGRKL